MHVNRGLELVDQRDVVADGGVEALALPDELGGIDARFERVGHVVVAVDAEQAEATTVHGSHRRAIEFFGEREVFDHQSRHCSSPKSE